jgi:hypothetical protein
MADFKVVFQFQTVGGNDFKWSEVFYRAADSATAAVPNAELLNARLKMLHSTSRMTKIRISDVRNPRASLQVVVNRIGNETQFSPLGIETAIVCSFASTLIPCSRRYWMRGGDIDDCQRDKVTGQDVFGVTFNRDFPAWARLLQAGNFEILPRTRASVNGYGYFKVLSVDGTTGPGKAVLQLTEASGLDPTMQLIVSSFSRKDLPGLAGVFPILATDNIAHTITIPYTTPTLNKVMTSVGRVRRYGIVTGATINADASGPLFLGGRKSKSSFTGSRGAKSATKGLRTSP